MWVPQVKMNAMVGGFQGRVEELSEGLPHRLERIGRWAAAVWCADRRGDDKVLMMAAGVVERHEFA